jgi:hypothetical protein
MKNSSNIFRTKFSLWGLGGFFFVTNTIFAQGPDPDNLPGDGNPTDAPINQQLVWLLVAAMVFAFVTYQKKMKTE